MYVISYNWVEQPVTEKILLNLNTKKSTAKNNYGNKQNYLTLANFQGCLFAKWVIVYCHYNRNNLGGKKSSEI